MAEVDCKSLELDQEEHSFFPNYFEVCVDSNVDFDIHGLELVSLHKECPMVSGTVDREASGADTEQLLHTEVDHKVQEVEHAELPKLHWFQNPPFPFENL